MSSNLLSFPFASRFCERHSSTSFASLLSRCPSSLLIEFVFVLACRNLSTPTDPPHHRRSLQHRQNPLLLVRTFVGRLPRTFRSAAVRVCGRVQGTFVGRGCGGSYRTSREFFAFSPSRPTRPPFLPSFKELGLTFSLSSLLWVDLFIAGPSSRRFVEPALVVDGTVRLA